MCDVCEQAIRPSEFTRTGSSLKMGSTIIQRQKCDVNVAFIVMANAGAYSGFQAPPMDICKTCFIRLLRETIAQFEDGGVKQLAEAQPQPEVSAVKALMVTLVRECGFIRTSQPINLDVDESVDTHYWRRGEIQKRLEDAFEICRKEEAGDSE